MADDRTAITGKCNSKLPAAAIVGAGVGLSIGTVERTRASTALVLIGSLAVIVIWWLVIARKGLRRDWLAPPVIFWAGVVLYYLVRPGSIALGMLPIGQIRTQHLEEAMGLVLLSIAGFVWGYALHGAEIIAGWLPRAPSGWRKARVVAAVGALWVVGASCWTLLIYGSGGVQARLSEYGQGVGAGQGIWAAISAAALSVALVLAWLQYLRGRFSRLAMFGIGASVVPMLAMHGQRSALIVPILMGVAVYHYYCQRLNLKQLVVIAIVVLMVFVGLGLPRLRMVPQLAVQVRPAAYARIGSWFFVRNLTSFDALMLLLEDMPKELDYQWGEGYWDALVMIVPRAIYSDKPQRNLFNRVLRPNRNTSMSLPPAGEGYLNFGWGGVLLEGVLLGLIYRVAYTYRQRYPDHEGVLLTYSFFFAFFMIIFRGGLMGGHLGLLVVYLMLIGVASVFCGWGRLVVRRESPKVLPACR